MRCGMLGCWHKDHQPLVLIREADTASSSLFGLRTFAQHVEYPAKNKDEINTDDILRMILSVDRHYICLFTFLRLIKRPEVRNNPQF